MIKRIGLFLIISIIILCMGAVAIYIINPFGVKTEKVRPRLFGFDIYRIPSKSMQPLLIPGDYTSVSNVAYLNNMPKRKDVVVFYKPNVNKSKPNSNSRIPFIKRAMAFAGDKVQIKNGKLIINNILIEENYVSLNNNKTPYLQKMKLTTIPENHIFVLGDNRDNSSDSRIFGPVAVDEVIAKASSILYGINGRSGSDIK